MPEMEDNQSARPSLVLRLGITGARHLRADQLERIRKQLRDVLGLVQVEMERLAGLDVVAASYAAEAEAGLQPKVYLVTPLALGADRLAARAALDQGFGIYVPMPFSKATYEEDFTGNLGKSTDAEPVSAEQDLGEFRELLARASARLELDGARSFGQEDDHSAARAYEAVGRFVVRHCDLLLAVWDGKPSNGRGGTAEIVRYAAITGIPVWWIHAGEAAEPEWLADIQDIQDPEPPASGAPTAEARLRAFLGRLISPPAHVPRHKASWLDHLATWFEEKEISSLDAYYKERPLAPNAIWRTYATVIGWAGGEVEDTQAEPAPPAPTPPKDPVAGYWFSKYASADERANGYAERYRSGYLLTILLTMLVLVCGACSLGLHVWFSNKKYWSVSVGIFELLVLFLITALILLAIHFEWHRKSIEYRLLAELFRKEETLATLGWALSVEKVQQLADSEQLSWVAWLFAATQRAGPLPQGRIARAESGRRILLNLLDEQLAYHRRREKKTMNASRMFERQSGWAFALVLFCVGVKIYAEVFEHLGSAVLLGVTATALAGVSAALVAIRGYAELPLLAEQSHHMIRELGNARMRVSRLDTSRPLVSQDLGAQAAAVATSMLQDLDGWGRLFRGKLMEAS
ncbi:MAG: hypothetical protein ABSG84_16980 [Acidobacteriaceae bacterium]|jgi:hypothetical protein